MVFGIVKGKAQVCKPEQLEDKSPAKAVPLAPAGSADARMCSAPTEAKGNRELTSFDGVRDSNPSGGTIKQAAKTAFTQALARVLMFPVNRIEVHGCIPEGGAVIASTHSSLVDSPVIGSLGNGVKPIARDKPGIFGKIMRLGDSIFTEKGQNVVEAVLPHLHQGASVWIAPGGTYSHEAFKETERGLVAVVGADGIAPGERTLGKGAARMAMRSGKPIVPMYIQGADAVWDKVKDLKHGKVAKLFTRPTINVYFGKPIYPECRINAERGGPEDDAAIKALTSKIGRELNVLRASSDEKLKDLFFSSSLPAAF